MQYSYDDVAEHDNAKTLAGFSSLQKRCPVSHAGLKSDNQCASCADKRSSASRRSLLVASCRILRQEPTTLRRPQHLTTGVPDWKLPHTTGIQPEACRTQPQGDRVCVSSLVAFRRASRIRMSRKALCNFSTIHLNFRLLSTNRVQSCKHLV